MMAAGLTVGSAAHIAPAARSLCAWAWKQVTNAAVAPVMVAVREHR